MPEYLAPGVYMEESGFPPDRIEGVSTSVAGFVGPTLGGPLAGAPELLTTFADFERVHGGLGPLSADSAPSPNHVAHAARAFFANGGRRLYVAPVAAGADAGQYAGTEDGDSGGKTGLRAFEDIEEISIVAAPGSTAPSGAVAGEPGETDERARTIAAHLIAHCETMRYRFAILDSPAGHDIDEIRAYRASLDSKYAALYYPWVHIIDPLTETEIELPPSGFVAGIYARTDTARGVHKAPANERIELVVALERDINQAQQEVLNPEGINCLRFLPGRGYRVWGARTITSDPEWKYVSVRRLLNFLEHSIDRGTERVVFEPNNADTWVRVRNAISVFLLEMWRSGALLGATPEDAFFVRCDLSTMTQSDIDNGRLICLIGIAPVRPAEFVIFRIGQWTADADR